MRVFLHSTRAADCLIAVLVDSVFYIQYFELLHDIKRVKMPIMARRDQNTCFRVSICSYVTKWQLSGAEGLECDSARPHRFPSMFLIVVVYVPRGAGCTLVVNQRNTSHSSTCEGVTKKSVLNIPAKIARIRLVILGKRTIVFDTKYLVYTIDSESSLAGIEGKRWQTERSQFMQRQKIYQNCERLYEIERWKNWFH